MPSDHVHERGMSGPYLPDGHTYFCTSCNLERTLHWWEGYEEAIEDIIASGLPWHDKRLVESAKAFGTLMATVREEPTDGLIVTVILDAYHAPLPPKEE